MITLCRSQEALDDLDAVHPDAGVEVENADGVLSFDLGTDQRFVLNKQAPNMQLWLSSPVRGPLRYEFRQAAWVNNRDGHPLLGSLAEDVASLSGLRLEFDAVEDAIADVLADLER
jgi:frataxin